MTTRGFQGPVLAVAAVALIIGVSWYRSSQTKTPPPAEIPEQAASAPAPAGAETKPNPRPAPGAITDAAESIEALRQMRQSAARRVVTAGREQLEGRFRSEPADPAWAAGAEQALNAFGHGGLIAQSDAEPRHMAVKCRSSVCRIEASFSNNSQAEDWFPQFALAAGPMASRASMQRRTDPDGTVHLEVYSLARQ